MSKKSMLEGYLDDINQTKQVKKPTPAQWHKAGMTAPEEEYLPPSGRATAPKSTPIINVTPAPTQKISVSKPSGGIIPTTSNSVSEPVKPTTPLFASTPVALETPAPTETPVDSGPSIQDLIKQYQDAVKVEDNPNYHPDLVPLTDEEMEEEIPIQTEE